MFWIEIHFRFIYFEKIFLHRIDIVNLSKKSKIFDKLVIRKRWKKWYVAFSITSVFFTLEAIGFACGADIV